MSGDLPAWRAALPGGVLQGGELDVAAEGLRRGAVLAAPTDTVAGLLCAAADAIGVTRVDALKGRPTGMELSLLAADVEQVREHAVLDERAVALAADFWPGAVSLIVLARTPKRLAIPRGPTLSVRVPGSASVRALAAAVGPLASTSANLHGEPAAVTWQDCLPLLERGVDAVLALPPSLGRASTIIDLTQAPPRVLRVGPLSVETLRPYLGG